MLVRASWVDQLKPILGAQLLVSRCRGSVTKSDDDRIQLVHAADVVHVGIELVAHAEVQRQLRMHSPVVLDEAGQVDVVGIRNHQILIGLAAAQRHREQQIVVVDPAVAVVIERGKVLDQLDAAVAEHSEVELCVHPLQLPAELPLMRSPHQRERIGELPSLLRRPLRHAEGRPRLDARKRQLHARATGAMVFSKSL